MKTLSRYSRSEPLNRSRIRPAIHAVLFLEAKVRFLTGTDTGGVPYLYYGFSLHDELALLVEAGFLPTGAANRRVVGSTTRQTSLQVDNLEVAQFVGFSKLD